MSAIDQYLYTCLGAIDCPISYELLMGYRGIVHIAIYILEQDIPEYETSFQGKQGDILVGGGSGETPALRIKMPDAIRWVTDFEQFDKEYQSGRKGLYTAYWSCTQAFMIGSGFVKLGWNPEEIDIENWIMNHVVSFLVQNYKERFSEFIGTEPLDYDGSICHMLTDEEDKIVNWQKYK